MAELPKGTVTFLLTDIEGSSVLWETHGDAMPELIRRHHAVLYEEIEKHEGGRPADQGEGDSVLAAFDRASDALRCAIGIQRRLRAEVWPEGIELKVRIACHTGEAEFRDAHNYAGPALNRAARLRGLAHGRQVLVSQATWDLVREKPPEGCSFRDLGSHRLKDLTDREQVFQVVHPHLPADFPALRSLDAFPTNLPTQLTSFIGREQEVAAVVKLISAHRLVTLTGAAGSGKTRLAVQVAADLVDDFPHGVWFVDLAAVTDPGLVAQTAATAMGIQLASPSSIEAEGPRSPQSDSARKLVEHIGPRTVLIVLDNCEHLVAASATFVDQVLRACSRLRIMATSREPLGVAGEATYRVPSLKFPESASARSPEEITGYEAVRLFTDRAMLAHGSFQLDAANAVAVAQIAFRLDGIPLALELAAARVKTLTPDQIASRLDDQFRLLTGGQRTALERQQTIRAAIDWSYDLLSESERILLRRLSVFHGGFTLEAVEEVCSGNVIEREELLDLLGELVGKSLVVREEMGREARYRILETIRQYGREKLIESKEALTFRERHRDHFLALAERAAPRLEMEDVGRWLDILEADIENIRGAIDWSLSEDDGAETAQRLVSALRDFWYLRGFWAEGHSFLDKAVAKEGDVPLPVKARAVSALAAYEFSARADLAEGRRRAEEAISLAKDSGVEGVLAHTKLVLGRITSLEGDFDAAADLFEEARAEGERTGEHTVVGRSLFGLFSTSLMAGNRRRAMELSAEMVRFAHALGRPVGISKVLTAAGSLEEGIGDFHKALSLYEEALPLAREVGDLYQMVRILGMMTRLLEVRGDTERAHAAWTEACAIAREKRHAEWIYFLASDAARRGDLEEACKLAEESLSLAREIGAPFPIASSLNGLAWFRYLSGDAEAAIIYLEEAERVAREGGGRLVLANVLHSLGEARRMAGQDGRHLLEESLEMGRSLGSPLVIATALWSLAEVERSGRNETRSAHLHLEGLEAARGKRNASEIQSLESIAGLLASPNPDAAAKLLGASENLRETLLEARPPVLRPVYESDVVAVRAALGAERFDTLAAEGRAMSLEEASAFAVKVLKAL